MDYTMPREYYTMHGLDNGHGSIVITYYYYTQRKISILPHRYTV